MNTIKKLTESISNFLTEIANHYEIPSSEIVSTLMLLLSNRLLKPLAHRIMKSSSWIVPVIWLRSIS